MPQATFRSVVPPAGVKAQGAGEGGKRAHRLVPSFGESDRVAFCGGARNVAVPVPSIHRCIRGTISAAVLGKQKESRIAYRAHLGGDRLDRVP